MILIKVHKSKFRDVIAICDSNLVGKKFEQNDLQLEITERFYKGRPIEEDELVAIMHDAENMNIVGEESIGVAVKAGIIGKSNIIKISGIPHAQFTTIE